MRFHNEKKKGNIKNFGETAPKHMQKKIHPKTKPSYLNKN